MPGAQSCQPCAHIRPGVEPMPGERKGLEGAVIERRNLQILENVHESAEVEDVQKAKGLSTGPDFLERRLILRSPRIGEIIPPEGKAKGGEDVPGLPDDGTAPVHEGPEDVEEQPLDRRHPSQYRVEAPSGVLNWTAISLGISQDRGGTAQESPPLPGVVYRAVVLLEDVVWERRRRKNMARMLPRILPAVLFAGCLVSGPAEGFKWTVRAPSEVVHAPHSRLHFTVETSTSDGKAVQGVPYVWYVDWVGLRGVEHQGRSFLQESILVKGGPGTAVLRILAHDPYDRPVEVAQAPIRVIWPQPGP